MKKLYFTLFVSLFAFALVWANDSERIIKPSELPQRAQQFIKRYYSMASVIRAVYDEDIFSKEYERIADRITKETHRGVTVLDGIGWYSKNHVKVLVVLAYKRQSVQIFRLVKEIDPNAFVSQSNVIGVFGEGFAKIKVK